MVEKQRLQELDTGYTITPTIRKQGVRKASYCLALLLIYTSQAALLRKQSHTQSS